MHPLDERALTICLVHISDSDSTVVTLVKQFIKSIQKGAMSGGVNDTTSYESNQHVHKKYIPLWQ